MCQRDLDMFEIDFFIIVKLSNSKIKNLNNYMIKNLKITFKYLSRFLLGIISVVILYFLLAMLLSYIPKNPKHEIECTENIKPIYLISNGIHLDIVFKVEQLDDILLEELNISKKAKYVAFGWGDEDFYLNTPTWNDLTTRTLAKALFWKSRSAMHVTEYRTKSSKFIVVPLCDVQLEILKNYVESSFAKANGKVVEIGKGYGKNDKFYEAKGSYNAIKTCNEWVNIGLKKAKVKTSIWSPFDKGILHHVGKTALPLPITK